MKKTIIPAFIMLILIFSCVKNNTPAAPADAATNTPVIINSATMTGTLTQTQTITMTSTVTQTATESPTPTSTCVLKTWYRDADSDNYGAPGVSLVSCNQPAGYILNGTDCNDGNPNIHPGSTEICDDVDNNCTGGVDEGCDDDNDNYCDSTMTVLGPVSTCAAGGGDCNDNNAAINPGRAEICNNSIDDDCDSFTDCADGNCAGIGSCP